MELWRERFCRIIPERFDPNADLQVVHFARMRNDAYAADFILPQGIGSTLYINLPGRSAGTLQSFTIHRGFRECFTRREVSVAAHLRRHLVNLYRLAWRLDQADRERFCASELAKAAGRLSAREAEVAGYLCRRITVRDIALRMRLSSRTVETYVERIYAKTGVMDRGAFLRRMQRETMSPLNRAAQPCNADIQGRAVPLRPYSPPRRAEAERNIIARRNSSALPEK
jgi:DNA-binding CsgD family transcriptional regulator